MTRITDDKGTRWVELPPRKRRKPPQPRRFRNLKVGDQLVKAQSLLHARSDHYIIVTDMWFDPVAGQDDPIAGQMVGYARIRHDGEILPRKSATTLRGLASQQYHYANIDYIAHCKARCAAIDGGKVVGIGYAKVLRKRPKTPGGGKL